MDSVNIASSSLALELLAGFACNSVTNTGTAAVMRALDYAQKIRQAPCRFSESCLIFLNALLFPENDADEITTTLTIRQHFLNQLYQCGLEEKILNLFCKEESRHAFQQLEPFSSIISKLVKDVHKIPLNLHREIDIQVFLTSIRGSCYESTFNSIMGMFSSIRDDSSVRLAIFSIIQSFLEHLLYNKTLLDPSFTELFSVDLSFIQSSLSFSLSTKEDPPFKDVGSIDNKNSVPVEVSSIEESKHQIDINSREDTPSIPYTKTHLTKSPVVDEGTQLLTAPHEDSIKACVDPNAAAETVSLGLEKLQICHPPMPPPLPYKKSLEKSTAPPLLLNSSLTSQDTPLAIVSSVLPSSSSSFSSPPPPPPPPLPKNLMPVPKKSSTQTPLPPPLPIKVARDFQTPSSPHSITTPAIESKSSTIEITSPSTPYIGDVQSSTCSPSGLANVISVKPLNWEKLPKAKIHGSIWESINHIDAFPNQDLSQVSPSIGSSGSPRIKKASLELQRAQNLNHAIVIDAIRDMDILFLKDEDLIRDLSKFGPKFPEDGLENIIKAADQIQNSGALRRLLSHILLVGNALNLGNHRGNACGFKLCSLQRLSDMKCNNGSSSLLQFIIEDVLSSELDDVLMPLSDLYCEYENLKSNIQLLDGIGSNSMTLQFFKKATLEIENLKVVLDTATSCTAQTLRYFGEEPDSLSFEELLQLLLNFLISLKVFFVILPKSITTGIMKRRFYNESSIRTSGHTKMQSSKENRYDAHGDFDLLVNELKSRLLYSS
ncbi:hypothetical protein DI09_60p30 [Mitosporidium daphniae]|uniref:FH2 domain-containing protein n=1 Tax=Mitosporidium daphniae TaxID=1485682 RepID=A0A098VSB1_9MICR|nr:uncharacterized protein DI09_60p30 [Mitosporidium daphniae]KGG50636.1 hypothetical protein DI09_60p30 [Mitosporidium daphniae]|eukprot:XP_013237080.1 uncharacterized protein DI09_60p30 [Mitosporidium daphniae]